MKGKEYPPILETVLVVTFMKNKTKYRSTSNPDKSSPDKSSPDDSQQLSRLKREWANIFYCLFSNNIKFLADGNCCHFLECLLNLYIFYLYANKDV